VRPRDPGPGLPLRDRSTKERIQIPPSLGQLAQGWFGEKDWSRGLRPETILCRGKGKERGVKEEIPHLRTEHKQYDQASPDGLIMWIGSETIWRSPTVN